MSRKYALGFVGAGNMAVAIMQAAVDTKILPANQMIASDPAEDRLDLFRNMSITVTDDNAEVIRESEQVLLAVKPQVFDDAKFVALLREHLADGQVLISIMAGIGTGKIATVVGKAARVIRVMPNTPMMVGLGMSGLAVGEHAQAGDEALAMELFGAAGEVVRVDEKLMDAVTAVSGSGPAYVYYLAEAMEKAAAELGLGEHARLFVTQTILGAAKMLADSPDAAAELRRKVTSPGGTTAAALGHLDSQKVVEVIVDAVKAAEARGRELGE